jgi:glycosyltransferase involved in cell wall biosynthesis
MSTLAVIIPSKNEERYLPVLLEGLAKQTRKPDELILADADSTDKTRDIALHHGFQIVLGGMPGQGRNAGAKVATSDLLLFLDADAIMADENFLQKAVDEFEERHLDIAAPDIYLTSGKFLESFGHKVYNRYVRMFGSRRPHTPGHCTLIRRSLFEAIGGYDESVVFLEDHNLAQRASKIGKFGFLNSVTIGVTDRRLRRDGSLKVAIIYILADIYTCLFGPIRKNYFNYGFSYDDDGS